MRLTLQFLIGKPIVAAVGNELNRSKLIGTQDLRPGLTQPINHLLRRVVKLII